MRCPLRSKYSRKERRISFAVITELIGYFFARRRRSVVTRSGSKPWPSRYRCTRRKVAASLNSVPRRRRRSSACRSSSVSSTSANTSATASRAMSRAMPSASIWRTTRARPRRLTRTSVRAQASAVRRSSSARSLRSRATASSMSSGSNLRRASRSRTCASASSRRARSVRPATYARSAPSDIGGLTSSEASDLRDAARLCGGGHLVAGHVRGRRNALHLELELVDIRRPAQRFFVRNQLLLEQIEDRLIERLHPVLRRALRDGAVNQVRLLLVHDAVADERGADQDFDGRRASLVVDLRDQALRDDRLQHAGELNADLLLLMRRKDRDDAVDRLRRVEGVQGGEDQVARLRRQQRGFDRLEVAHFADEDDVRILSQGAPQRVREGHRVHADLALVDERAVVAVQVFDRILDRHDVRGAGRCALVDPRRERRALARAGGARHEHQAALVLRDLLEDLRQRELVDGRNLHRDDAEDHPDGAALLERVAAEAAEAGDAVGEVDLAVLLELFPVPGRQDRRGNRDHVVVVEPLVFSRRHKRPADAHHGVAAGLQVKVGGPAFDSNLQKVVDVHAVLYRPFAVPDVAAAGALTACSQPWVSGASPFTIWKNRC